jgi:hypothetical protein
MTDLAGEFKYANTSTGGYCATGNSTIESFWQYFNVCLRNLSDEDYQNVGDHMQHIAWAWNTTVSSSTGVRPFEVMTGTTPVTITDALILPPPTNGTINMSNIRQAAAAYSRSAIDHANYMRELRARIYNERGRKLKALKVGDFVKIYVPPSQGEAVRRRRKCKHICQWHGPLKLMKALSNMTFELTSNFNSSRVFRRHLSNIHCWRGPLPAIGPGQEGVILFTSDVEVGEFAFVSDADFETNGATLLHLVIVSRIDDSTLSVEVWGTTSRDAAAGSYKPVFIMESSGAPTTAPRRGRKKFAWSWQIAIADVEGSFILRNIDVLESGKLAKESRKRVHTLPSRFTHRRFMS